MHEALSKALTAVEDASADRIMESLFWRRRTAQQKSPVAVVVHLSDRRRDAAPSRLQR